MADRPSAWIQRPEGGILEQDMIPHNRRPLDAIQPLITTIQSLPNEVLTDIIRSACAVVEQPPPHTPVGPGVLLDIPPPMSKFSETPKFSALIATILSLVCKRWRLVILSDLVLWSDIIISRHGAQTNTFDHALKWAIAYATHSNPIPISISVTSFFGSPEAPARLVQFINNSGERIRELKAYLRMTDDFTKDFEKLQSPMPNLEVLEIGCSPDWGTPRGVELPQLFSRKYPLLKHLSIQHFTVVPPRAFTNLATLVLSYSHGRVTLEDFLALISGSPRLETLWMKRYGVVRPRSSDPPAPVSLPRLSSITLENCDSHLILSTLIIPQTATLRIMYPMHYLGRRPRNTLADALPLKQAIVGPLKNAQTLSYGVDETTAVLFFKDSQGQKLVHVEQAHKVPNLVLFPFGRQADGFFNTRFYDLFALDQAADLLGSLTTLELDLRGLPNHGMGGSHLSFWLALFECTPLLETLRVSYSYLPEMLDGLNPPNNDRKVLCPSLRTLQLDIRTGAFDFKNDWLLQVIDTTRWRGKCGSPLRDVFVYLVSSSCGQEFALPSDAVRAMFSLKDAGVENMVFSNGTSTHRFDKDNFTVPELPRPFWEGWAATTTGRTNHQT